MNKSIILFLSLFSFVNSDAFAGKTYAVFGEVEADESHYSLLGYSGHIELFPDDKENFPEEVSRNLFKGKNIAVHQIDLDVMREANKLETSVSGKTGIFSLPASSDQGYHKYYLTVVLIYNLSKGYMHQDTTYYPASIAHIEHVGYDGQWPFSISGDVEQSLFKEKANWRVEKKFLGLLNDGSEGSIPEKLYKRMQKHQLRKLDLFSKNASQIMKAKIEAQGQKDIEEGYL